MFPVSIHEWCKQPYKKRALEARNLILTCTELHRVAGEVIGFIVVQILSGKADAANHVFTQLSKIPDLVVFEEHQLMLDLFWMAFSNRPEKVPWPLDEARLENAKRTTDPANLEFYEKWTDTAWIESMLALEIGESYDAHKWKTSQDVWTHAICARLLCQPKDGKVPSRESIEESYEAAHKLFTTLPPRDETSPHSHVFEVRVYFILAIYLGKMATVRQILQECMSMPWLEIHNLLHVPALYKMLEASGSTLKPAFMDEALLKETEEDLSAALETRAKDGRREPLHDVSMPELLRRFSEAAFSVYKAKYIKQGIETPESILLPPITTEDIEDIEADLGPLPPDVKEMALIADGFYGGWHFAGGGWNGISKLNGVPASNYEIYLDYWPEAEERITTVTKPDGTTQQVTTKTVIIGSNDRNWGNVYYGGGAAENDDYEHLLCPHEVWKKLQHAGGKEVREGDYAFVYFAHWTGGGEKIYPSVRAWIAQMTMALEVDAALGIQAYGDEDEDEDEE